MQGTESISPCKPTIAWLALLGASSLAVAAWGIDGVPIEGRANVDVSTAYLWRGRTFNDDFVIQPSLNVVTKAGIGIDVWANYDVDDYAGQVRSGNVSEVDLAVFYRLALDTFTFEAGVVEYLYDRTDYTRDTSEAYVRADWASNGLGAEVGAYYDFDELDALYVDLTLSYVAEVTDDLDLMVAASAGFAGSGMTQGDAGWHDFTLSVGMTYYLTRDVSLGASLAYTDRLAHDVLLDPDVRVHASAHVSWCF